MSLAGVGSTRSVPATLRLPRSQVCALPVYIAQAPGCSIGSGPCVVCGSSFRVFHKSADLDGPAFCDFPAQAAQAAQSLTRACTLPGCGAPSPPPCGPSLSFSCTGWVRLVSVLGDWSLAATLPADVNHRESQKVFGQKLGGCLQFGRGVPSLGPRLPLSPPPASCLWWGMGRSAG